MHYQELSVCKLSAIYHQGQGHSDLKGQHRFSLITSVILLVETGDWPHNVQNSILHLVGNLNLKSGMIDAVLRSTEVTRGQPLVYAISHYKA